MLAVAVVCLAVRTSQWEEREALAREGARKWVLARQVTATAPKSVTPRRLSGVVPTRPGADGLVEKRLLALRKMQCGRLMKQLAERMKELTKLKWLE